MKKEHITLAAKGFLCNFDKIYHKPSFSMDEEHSLIPVDKSEDSLDLLTLKYSFIDKKDFIPIFGTVFNLLNRLI